jgi:hypothetical protein
MEYYLEDKIRIALNRIYFKPEVCREEGITCPGGVCRFCSSRYITERHFLSQVSDKNYLKIRVKKFLTCVNMFPKKDWIQKEDYKKVVS